MPELIRLNGILAKIESTYKTDSVPVIANDGIQVEESVQSGLTWGFLEDNLRDDTAGQFLGRSSLGKPAGRWVDLELTCALKGREAAFSSSILPECAPLLRACGLTEVDDFTASNEFVEFTPRSTGFESVTIHAYAAEKLFKILGCMGSVKIIMTPGQHPMAVFSMRGVMPATPTQASLGTIVYPAKGVVPPTVKGAGLTLNSVDPPGFDDFELESNSNVVDRPNGNDADGFAGVYIVDHDPMINVTIEQVPIATFDPWTLHETPTLFSWDIGPFGPAQYNKVKISGPKGRIVSHNMVDSDGIASGSLTIRCNHTDEETEDCFTLRFE